MQKGNKEKRLQDKELRLYIKSLPQGKMIEENSVRYHTILKDKFLIFRAVKRGVTNYLFQEIKANAPFDEKQWSHFLNLNIRTLQRYKSDKTHVFKPILSERIFELAEVVSLGNMVFDSREDFHNWLTTPSLALGKEEPINLLDNSYGIGLVIAELNRIEYGIFVS